MAIYLITAVMFEVSDAQSTTLISLGCNRKRQHLWVYLSTKTRNILRRGTNSHSWKPVHDL